MNRRHSRQYFLQAAVFLVLFILMTLDPYPSPLSPWIRGLELLFMVIFLVKAVLEYRRENRAKSQPQTSPEEPSARGDR